MLSLIIPFLFIFDFHILEFLFIFDFLFFPHFVNVCTDFFICSILFINSCPFLRIFVSGERDLEMGVSSFSLRPLDLEREMGLVLTVSYAGGLAEFA